MNVRLDSSDGDIAACAETKDGLSEYVIPLRCEITGKRALFFEFIHEDTDKQICEFDCFTFE